MTPGVLRERGRGLTAFGSSGDRHLHGHSRYGVSCVRCVCALPLSHFQGWDALMLAAKNGEDTKVKTIHQKNKDGMKSAHFSFSSQYVRRYSKRLK